MTSVEEGSCGRSSSTALAGINVTVDEEEMEGVTTASVGLLDGQEAIGQRLEVEETLRCDEQMV
jgi:hypothetical protein